MIKQEEQEIKRVQKLVPKGEMLVERYIDPKSETTDWFITKKLTGEFIMYHIYEGKAVKLGKANNPRDLEQYVPWCN